MATEKQRGPDLAPEQGRKRDVLECLWWSVPKEPVPRDEPHGAYAMNKPVNAAAGPSARFAPGDARAPQDPSRGLGRNRPSRKAGAFICRMRLATLVPIGGTVVLLVMVVRIHWAYLQSPAVPLSFDEPAMAAISLRLMAGHWLPTVDAYCQRGPMLHWLATAFQWAFGRFDWTGIRVLGLLTHALTILGALVAGFAGKRPLAGLVAGIVYTYIIGVPFDLGGGMGVGGESIGATFSMWALAAALAALTCWPTLVRRRAVFLSLAGAMLALAGLTKQTASVELLPFLLWVLADGWTHRFDRTRAPWWRDSAWLLAGWFTPILLTLVRYAISGKLHQLVYWTVTYNAAVYMQPYAHDSKFRSILEWIGREPWALLAAIMLLSAGLASSLGSMRAFRFSEIVLSISVRSFAFVVALESAIMLAAAASTMRFWPHYFVISLPWLGLLAGLSAQRAVRSRRPVGEFLSNLMVCLALLAFAGIMLNFRFSSAIHDRRLGIWTDPHDDPICTEIQKASGPHDKIFIWGFDGDLYINCRREPASRFVYGHYIAGIVPPFWNDARPERAARHAVEDLLDDLRQSRPPLILDMPGRLGGFSMRQLPAVAEFLSSRYRRGPVVTSRDGREATFFTQVLWP
jgi:hypothetical protein